MRPKRTAKSEELHTRIPAADSRLVDIMGLHINTNEVNQHSVKLNVLKSLRSKVVALL